jgi:hypothetical protein
MLGGRVGGGHPPTPQYVKKAIAFYDQQEKVLDAVKKITDAIAKQQELSSLYKTLDQEEKTLVVCGKELREIVQKQFFEPGASLSEVEKKVKEVVNDHSPLFASDLGPKLEKAYAKLNEALGFDDTENLVAPSAGSVNS